MKNHQKNIKRLGSYKNQFIAADQIEKMIYFNYNYMDFHVHTMYSYDVVPSHATDPLNIYQKGIDLGFKFITFTDHNTMDAYDRVGWTRERIVPGVELKILDEKRIGHTIHLNIYGLDKKQFGELQDLTLIGKNVEQLVEYLNENKLCYVLNHPFWHELNETMNIQALLDISHLFPVFEYNMGRVQELNDLAVELAYKNNAGILAGSDSHIGNIGRILTFAEGDTFKEFFQNIKDRKALIIPQSMNSGLFYLEVMERVKTLFKERDDSLPEQHFDLETGIKAVDQFASSLQSSSPQKYPKIMLSMLKIIIRILMGSRLPASLYFQGQRKLASEVKDRIFHYQPSGTLQKSMGYGMS
jgi:predicted metal-dependent phosphoesterase TrpH